MDPTYRLLVQLTNMKAMTKPTLFPFNEHISSLITPKKTLKTKTVGTDLMKAACVMCDYLSVESLSLPVSHLLPVVRC